MGSTRRWAVLATGGVALLLGCDSDETPTCICEPASPAIVTTFADESAFVSQVSPTEPLNAPLSDREDSIVVGDDRFIIKPGSGVDKIAVSNVVGDHLPSDLGVACECRSNLDFAFISPVSGFGLGVASWTATGYRGYSDFVIILYHEGAPVGSAQFSTPAAGESFFALMSSVRFDALTLRETRGGPQEGPVATGGVDREFFGNFYVVP
jgi:hypothetical protein